MAVALFDAEYAAERWVFFLRLQTHGDEMSKIGDFSMSEVELKPCPFCGGEAEVSVCLADTFYVKCQQCGVLSVFWKDQPNVADAWNRRTTDMTDCKDETGGIKLRPCPFCGGKADVDIYKSGDYHAQCLQCGTLTKDFPNTEEAAAAWNMRV